jgi:uncharacterized protein with NRDE domain
MCLIVFSHQQHPQYPLLVAANRDEHYQRPATAADFWPEYPQLMAGRDLEAGGTWLGITRTGRFAAITNHRNPPTMPEQPRSRGMLTLDFLLGDGSPQDYLQRIALDSKNYAGFNLLVGDHSALYYYSNIEEKITCLPPGTYGLSNAELGTAWPKAIRGCNSMEGLIAANELGLEQLQSTISRREAEPDSALPDTGVGIDFERLLSPQFIVSPDYGTRACTSLKVDSAGNIAFREALFGPGGVATGAREFEIEPA